MINDHVLVVEDEGIIALHIRDVLTKLGYSVLGPVGSGEEAIQLAARACPDAVLMDVRLQGQMSGMEAAAQIYARFNVPVIYLTAYAEDNVLRQAKITEPYGYLVKPVQDRELRATIEMALYRHRMDQKLKESEERYRAISELTSDYACAFRVEPDDSLVLEWMAGAFFHITGFTAEEFKASDGWSKLVHPGDMAITVQRRVAMLAGQPDVSEFRIITKSGEVRWLRDHGRPVWDEAQGRVVRIYCAAQDITERKRAEEEIRQLNQNLERRAKELAALNKTSQAMTSTLNLDAVLELVIAEIRNLVDAEDASVLLQEGPELVFAATASSSAGKLVGMRMPVTAGIAGWVLREGKPVLVSDTRSDPRFYDRIDTMTGVTTRSLLAVPLVVKGVVRGVVEAINKMGSVFDTHDLELVEDVAGSAATAIENARLFAAVDKELFERERAEAEIKKLNQDLERHARELAALNKAGQAIASTLDPKEVLRLVIADARSLLDAEMASVLLHEPASNELVFAAVASPGSEELTGIRMPATAGIAGRVMQDKQPMLVGDARSEPRFYDRIDTTTDLAPRALLAVPLVVKDKAIGVLEAISKMGGVFTQRDLEAMQTLSGSAVIAIENARLYQAEREQFRRLQQSQTQLVHAEKMAALGRLTASIAHEINNPLQAVQGCLTLIKEDLEDTQMDESRRRENMKHDLQVAEAEIARVANIVHRLRDFYRPAREGLSSTDVHAVLENLLALIDKQLQHSSISVELAWDHLPTIQTNPDQLKQVFLNLALNAIDAMPEGGTLRIRTALEQLCIQNNPQPLPVVRIEFSDSGQGIPTEMLSRIFEPFFTTKESGSGLGLSISYEIIQSLRGEITVTSQVGKGTTFTILLPVGETHAQE